MLNFGQNSSLGRWERRFLACTITFKNFLGQMNYQNEGFTRSQLNNQLFQAELQEFSQQVAQLSKLQANGQISEIEAVQQIDFIWQKFEFSVKQLEIESYEDR